MNKEPESEHIFSVGVPVYFLREKECLQSKFSHMEYNNYNTCSHETEAKNERWKKTFQPHSLHYHVLEMKATTVQCENYKWQNLRMEQGEDKLKTFDNDDAK